MKGFEGVFLRIVFLQSEVVHIHHIFYGRPEENIIKKGLEPV
jgi:hypothetical protein